MRKLSGKQLRYLWAVGYFKAKPSTAKVEAEVLGALSTIRQQDAAALAGRNSRRAQLKKRLQKAEDAYYKLDDVISDKRSAARKSGDEETSNALRTEARKLEKRWDNVRDQIRDKLDALNTITVSDPNSILHHMAKQKGFDGLPKLGSKADVDAAVQAGATELYRGVVASRNLSGREIHDQLRTGKYQLGRGIYGNGLYFSPKRETAEDYSDDKPGSILRVALSKDARVIDHHDLIPLYRAAVDRDKEFTAVDESAFAMAMGYDAIRAAKTKYGVEMDAPHWVILNRTKLIVEK